MGPVALGRIFVYFAKKLSTSVVDVCDRRVLPLQNFVRPYQTSKKPRQKIGEPKGLADFLSGDFIALFCLFSVTKSISTFHTRVSCKFKSAPNCKVAWTEKISLAIRTKISKVYFPRTYFFYCRCLYSCCTEEEETVNLWVEYHDRLEGKDSRKYSKRENNLIDVFGIKDKIVTSQCDHV